MAPERYVWAEGPMSLIPTPRAKTGKTDQYTLAATEMAIVHNAIIRSLNGIYHTAPHVPEDNREDFVQYALEIVSFVELHEGSEEQDIFPYIEEMTGVKGIMDGSREQHASLHHGLEEFRSYLTSFSESDDYITFSGARLQQIFNSFRVPLSDHLRGEVDSLLALSRFGDRLQLLKLFEELEKKAKSVSFTKLLPAVMLNHDVTYEGGIHGKWPPLPHGMAWAVLNFGTFWNKGWWKFTTCDFSQKPKPMDYT